MEFREFFISRGFAVYFSVIIVVLLLPISIKCKLNMIGYFLAGAAVPFIVDFVMGR